MAIVGFTNYQAFYEELRDHGQWDWPVRVAHYHKIIPSSNTPITLYKFFVVAACETDRDTLVCRFQIGQTQIWGDDDQGRLVELDELSLKVKEGLIRSLQTLEWTQIRAGIIAAADQSETDAGPGRELL
ncbi:MAG: hypothetical protein KDJ52_00075 [Anaerolineae bacterium]|nr:hypothetical protein [Anaerolineae bacterium]